MRGALDTSSPAPPDDRLTLPDGRRITFRRYGAPDGRALLALHGTPGSRLKFSATDEVARALGLCVIAPDRWGYGGTDVHPAPSLAAFAVDMSALMAACGASRYAVMGVSGGGPYAAAVAACHINAVTVFALVAPVGPIAGESHDGMSYFHRFCFGPLARSPRATRAVFGAYRRPLLAAPRVGLAIAMSRVPPADRLVLAFDDVRDRLAETFVEGLRGGAEGPVIDLTLFGRPWDIPLADAHAQSRLWIGTADRNVPIAAAHRLAGRLPNCEISKLPGEGHLWVALNYPTVLSWIASSWK